MNIAKFSMIGLLTLAPLAEACATDTGGCAWTRGANRPPSKSFPPAETWYGTEKLAVILPAHGKWRGLGSAHNYRDKLFLWSKGFEAGLEKNLTIKGVRLDGASPPAVISKPTNAHAESLGGWAMLVLVELPSAGCWQITGEYMGERITFVVQADHEETTTVPAN
jgi:hypothetical protein